MSTSSSGGVARCGRIPTDRAPRGRPRGGDPGARGRRTGPLDVLDRDLQPGRPRRRRCGVGASYRAAVDVGDKREELAGPEVERSGTPAGVLQHERDRARCLPAHLVDAHLPQGVVRRAGGGRAPPREAAAPAARDGPDLVVALLPQPGAVDTVHHQPHQPAHPRDHPDGLHQERGRTAVRLGRTGGEMLTRQRHQVRHRATADVGAGGPQARARHGVVVRHLGVLDLDEQRQVRGHPAQRHRLQERGVVGDRAAAADVQHTVAPRYERGEREPLVLQHVVERVGPPVALTVRDDECPAVQDPRHRLPVPARTRVAPGGRVPRRQREERRRGQEIGDSGPAQGPVTRDLGDRSGRFRWLPQAGPEHGLGAVDVRLLDVDGRLRTLPRGHRAVDAQEFPDTGQEEEARDRTVRGGGLRYGEGHACGRMDACEPRGAADEGRPAGAVGIPVAEGRDRTPGQDGPAALVEGADLLEHDRCRRAAHGRLHLLHRRQPTRGAPPVCLLHGDSSQPGVDRPRRQ